MRGFTGYLQNFDWILIVSAVLLIAFGLLSIYSSSLGMEGFDNLKKQLIFAAIGLVLMFSLSFIDYRVLRNDPYLILSLYFVCLVLLAGLFFFAPEIRGVKGWYKLGPISIDPIEFTKIILIILLAKYFSKRHIEVYRIRYVALSGFYVLLPAILVFFQPDLGSVLILFALWLGLLVISGIKLKHFLLLILLALLVLALSWGFLLKDYQKERITSFIIPTDPLGIDWNQNQAKIAIGAGGITGQGIGMGSQTQYGFLPEPQTDFIFAAIAEETGLIGVTVLLLLFAVLVWRIISIAILSRTNFSRLFATGLSILIVSQIFIHIGMNLGILPIIGISLPLVSYGGSGLVVFLGGLGILQSMKNNP